MILNLHFSCIIKPKITYVLQPAMMVEFWLVCYVDLIGTIAIISLSEKLYDVFGFIFTILMDLFRPI